jgi:hypothetical protein
MNLRECERKLSCPNLRYNPNIRPKARGKLQNLPLKHVSVIETGNKYRRNVGDDLFDWILSVCIVIHHRLTTRQAKFIQYFPTIQDRLRSKIKLTPKITAVFTGHGMTKAYLHLSEEATCSCGNEYQSMDHLLFHCANTRAQREVLIQQLGTWPASKRDLILKYHKEFSAFVE